MADPRRSEAALDAFYVALLSDDAEALYERAPCGYLSTTPDGTIVKVNGTFLTWTGWTAAELVGQKRFVDLLTGGGRIYHETHYATTLQMHGTVREVALDLVTPDGRRLPALVNSVLERADDGTPLVVRTVVFDATERRRYEQELLLAKQRAEEAEAKAVAVARAAAAHPAAARPADDPRPRARGRLPARRRGHGSRRRLLRRRPGGRRRVARGAG